MAEHEQNGRSAPDESGAAPAARGSDAGAEPPWPSPHPALTPFRTDELGCDATPSAPTRAGHDGQCEEPTAVHGERHDPTVGPTDDAAIGGHVEQLDLPEPTAGSAADVGEAPRAARPATYRPLYRRPVEQRSLFPEIDGPDRAVAAEAGVSSPNAEPLAPPVGAPDVDPDPDRAGRPSAEPVDVAAAALSRFEPDDDRPIVRPDLSAERLDQALTSIFAGLAARADPSNALVGPGLTEPPATEIPSRHAGHRGLPAPSPDSIPVVHLTDVGLPRRAPVAGGDFAPPAADARLRVAAERPDPATFRPPSIARTAHDSVRRVDDDGPARLADDAIDRLETALGPMIADAAEARADHDADAARAPATRVPAATPLERRSAGTAPSAGTVFGVADEAPAPAGTTPPEGAPPILPGPVTRAAGDDGMGDIVAFPSDARDRRPPPGDRRATTARPVEAGRRNRRGWAAAAVALVVGAAGVTYLATRGGGGSLASDTDGPAASVAQLSPDPTSAPVTSAPAVSTVRDAAAPTPTSAAVGPAPTTPESTGPLEAIEIGLEGQFVGTGNDEWVRVVNEGSTAVNLAGWSLRDDGFAHLFQFGDRVLEPGTAITLYSGCGANNITELYWCTTTDDIWDDTGDVATLFDGDQFVVAVTRN